MVEAADMAVTIKSGKCRTVYGAASRQPSLHSVAQCHFAASSQQPGRMSQETDRKDQKSILEADRVRLRARLGRGSEVRVREWKTARPPHRECGRHLTLSRLEVLSALRRRKDIAVIVCTDFKKDDPSIQPQRTAS